MGRGSSQSQTTTSSSNTRPSMAAPRGSAAATAGMRRRKITTSGVGDGGGAGGGGGGGLTARGSMLRFYTDDAPGMKVTPTAVLVLSLCFIAFVTALHVVGKLYRKSPTP